MSAASKLRETIDRLVEDSIRRILPEVMNEVLLKAMVNMGTIQEERQPVTRTQRAVAQPRQSVLQPRRPATSSKLQSLLEDMGDGTAGAEFYGTGAAPSGELDQTDEYHDEPPTMQSIHERTSMLAPHLQGLTEGMDLSDFAADGESWDGTGSSTSNPPMQMGPPLDKAAKAIGMDFSRMKKLSEGINKKAPKVDVDDKQANAQFELNRIKRNRERLNDGKPVE